MKGQRGQKPKKDNLGATLAKARHRDKVKHKRMAQTEKEFHALVRKKKKKRTVDLNHFTTATNG